MMVARALRMAGLTLLLVLGTLSATAQDGRDPTVAPPELGATVQSPIGVEGMSVLVRDGRPYLVVGTRLYAPGDKVGLMRVERITETEVWLHDGSALIKVARFAGIERKVVVPKPRCDAAAPAPDTQAASAPTSKKARTSKAGTSRKQAQAARPPASAPQSVPEAAPCEDTQP